MVPKGVCSAKKHSMLYRLQQFLSQSVFSCSRSRHFNFSVKIRFSTKWHVSQNLSSKVSFFLLNCERACLAVPVAAIIVRIRGLLLEIRVGVGRHESSRRIEFFTFFRRFQKCLEIVENCPRSAMEHACLCRLPFPWCQLVLSWLRSGRLKINCESLRRLAFWTFL